ncbi:hypothetical protein Q1695_004729 [Nippostrongylus brasiliensis]|nr:hypothetical protein Q1695_004729 [Nippostrongylus brasiliensis]
MLQPLIILIFANVFIVSNGIKCIYGSNNGYEGWFPKAFQGDSSNKFCLNITMPIDVGSSTLYLCDAYGFCKVDGCRSDDHGRKLCCCSVDLCNSATYHGILLLFIIPLTVAFISF